MLLIVFNHPLHGPDVRQSSSEVLRVFDQITVAAVIGDDRIGFSIGDTGGSDDLRRRLDRMEGPVESGRLGAWPTVAAAH